MSVVRPCPCGARVCILADVRFTVLFPSRLIRCRCRYRIGLARRSDTADVQTKNRVHIDGQCEIVSLLQKRSSLSQIVCLVTFYFRLCINRPPAISKTWTESAKTTTYLRTKMCCGHVKEHAASSKRPTRTRIQNFGNAVFYVRCALNCCYSCCCIVWSMSEVNETNEANGFIVSNKYQAKKKALVKNALSDFGRFCFFA